MGIHSCTDSTIRYTLHVPCQYNGGGLLDSSQWEGIEQTLLDAFGAFTLTEAVGVWRSADGRVYKDAQRLYMVDVTHSQAGVLLREYADQLRDALKQECIYVTGIKINTWLV